MAPEFNAAAVLFGHGIIAAAMRCGQNIPRVGRMKNQGAHAPRWPSSLPKVPSARYIESLQFIQGVQSNEHPMNLPHSESRELTFQNGTALGFSHRWREGQYCSILTEAGIVGCGIYDTETAGEFGQAIAIAKGTPAQPLTVPEDLYEAKIVRVTPKARFFGIVPGMTGREAVEKMLLASSPPEPGPLKTTGIDHVTLVVADLERSKQFYVGILGMEVVERPGFSFPGMWFQAGKTQIHLILEHEGTAPSGFPGPSGSAKAGRTFHYAFEVADARTAFEVLQKNQVPIRGEPKFRPDGCLQVFCVDPDNHIVEVFSRPRS